MIPAKRFTFPKSRRLTRASEFERVRKAGRSQNGRLLTLAVLGGAERPGVFRAGFVTSRKIGSAVKRNRVRRRLREIVRKHQHKVIDAVSVVTIARIKSAHVTYQELEDEWLRLAKRASILAP